MRVLALDCGGTRSTAILVDREDRLVAQLVLPAANVYISGPAGLAAVVLRAVGSLPGAEAVSVAAAGVRTETDRRNVVAAIRQEGVRQPLFVCSDAHAALRAGGIPQGIVVVAGTGSAALSVGADGGERRAGGWGGVLGDDGSGYWIGREMLRRVVRAADGSDERLASLRSAVLDHLGLQSVEDLRGVASGPDARARVAGLVPLFASLWRSGHREIDDLVENAARELARLVRVAAAGQRFDPPVTVLLAGGVFQALPELETRLGAMLKDPYTTRRLGIDPAWGALWLALERDDWDGTGAAERVRPTEAANPVTENMSRMTTLAMLETMNEQDRLVAPAVAHCLESIARLVDETARRMKPGGATVPGRLLYVGAGTSGRLAMLDAVECVPTFGLGPEEVTALIAGGAEALTRAVEGAEDDVKAGARAVVDAQVCERDVVVGVSASGDTPYVRGALSAARTRGACTALVTCNREATALDDVDIGVAIQVGPEVIAGSTRLKAGTAQKMVLNMVSTCVMVRLGRTLGNQMIGVRPTNRKLRERATRLVRQLAHVEEEEALAALETVGWRVPEAVLTARLGGPDEAAALLARHGGDLAASLAELDSR